MLGKGTIYHVMKGHILTRSYFSHFFFCSLAHLHVRMKDIKRFFFKVILLVNGRYLKEPVFDISHLKGHK